MTESIIIIGAGVAGLAAGCYGQMNGYRTAIFEMHDQPGGLCTGWRRNGYTFDGCIHWLMGTSPRSPFYKVWSELGVMHDCRMIAHEEFVRITGPDGRELKVYTNIDRFEQHLQELSPADAPVIEELTGALRKWRNIDLSQEKPPELMDAQDQMKAAARMAPYMGELNKWVQTTVDQFAARFQDPFLRRAFPLIFGGGDMPMMAFLMFLAPMDHGDCGVPEGGSAGFSKAIARRYTDLGGKIHYRARVEEILEEGGKAAGVRLADGSVHRADVVISAADGRTTLYKLLGGRHMSDYQRHAYETWPTFSSLVQVSLGIKRDLSTEPQNHGWLLEQPLEVAGKSHDALNIKHYCYDRSLAPQGKSVVEVLLMGDYDYWKRLADEDRERYDAEKQQTATRVIDFMEQHYPGITRDIEAVDVATPLTTERYTASYRGSIQGWALAGEILQKGLDKTVPGLENFYMIGQWVETGGGLPGVAPSGRRIIQIICHKDGKRFTTSVPDSPSD
jgi:phytoene dehydrogenase-like protein